jgi:hypothetical protein
LGRPGLHENAKSIVYGSLGVTHRPLRREDDAALLYRVGGAGSVGE